MKENNNFIKYFEAIASGQLIQLNSTLDLIKQAKTYSLEHTQIEQRKKIPYEKFPDTVNVNQASEILGIRKQTIYDRKMKGLIPYCKVGGKLVFQKIELIKLLNKSF